MRNTNRVFSKQRDLDIRIAARKIMARYRGEALPFGRLVDMTLESQAPGYYLSVDYATRMISLYRRGKLPPPTIACKRLMWTELDTRVTQAMRHYRLTDLSTAVRYVLAIGDASRFFVSRSTAARILLRQYGGATPVTGKGGPR